MKGMVSSKRQANRNAAEYGHGAASSTRRIERMESLFMLARWEAFSWAVNTRDPPNAEVVLQQEPLSSERSQLDAHETGLILGEPFLFLQTPKL